MPSVASGDNKDMESASGRAGIKRTRGGYTRGNKRARIGQTNVNGITVTPARNTAVNISMPQIAEKISDSANGKLDDITKCLSFFKVIIETAKKLNSQSEPEKNSARRLIGIVQMLIQGVMDPVTFTNNLQAILGCKEDFNMASFLEKALPGLRAALRCGKVSYYDIIPPEYQQVRNNIPPLNSQQTTYATKTTAVSLNQTTSKLQSITQATNRNHFTRPLQATVPYYSTGTQPGAQAKIPKYCAQPDKQTEHGRCFTGMQPVVQTIHPNYYTGLQPGTKTTTSKYCTELQPATQTAAEKGFTEKQPVAQTVTSNYLDGQQPMNQIVSSHHTEQQTVQQTTLNYLTEPQPVTQTSPDYYNERASPKCYTQLQPVKKFDEPQPGAEYTELQPLKEFDEPQPGAEYTELQPLKEFDEPQPDAQYAEPQPVNQFTKPHPGGHCAELQPVKQSAEPQPGAQYAELQPVKQFSKLQPDTQCAVPKPVTMHAPGKTISRQDAQNGLNANVLDIMQEPVDPAHFNATARSQDFTGISLVPELTNVEAVASERPLTKLINREALRRKLVQGFPKGTLADEEIVTRIANVIEEKVKSIIERLRSIAKYRVDSYRQNWNQFGIASVEVSSDAKRQLRLLKELEEKVQEREELKEHARLLKKIPKSREQGALVERAKQKHIVRLAMAKRNAANSAASVALGIPLFKKPLSSATASLHGPNNSRILRQPVLRIQTQDVKFLINNDSELCRELPRLRQHIVFK